MTEPLELDDDVLLPGPDGQDIDLHAELPTPEDLGEPDAPSATHGDFHDRGGVT